jgi:hypothetical protein
MEINSKDPGKGHFYVSIFKSILRIGACYGLWLTGDIMLQAVGVLFALAEVLGIVEEVV